MIDFLLPTGIVVFSFSLLPIQFIPFVNVSERKVIHDVAVYFAALPPPSKGQEIAKK